MHRSHALGACHQGAAIEGLCLTNDTLTTPARPYTTFYHNVSSQSGNTVNADNTLGVLGWHLTLGALRVPSAMNFDYDPGSNLATPVIMPGQSRYEPVAFEAGTNHMYIPVKQNDQVSPPEPYLPPLKLKNWFNCLTRYSYTYETLAWKVGMTGEPQNPTCTAVEVHRVWV
ncbi:hypothetical protein BDW02DRAFT_551553 [Decorospora gaudefroyi]|uniref:DUF7907 domain-containing protein n=1 Tax=Decorospora gaudefroyi TaxID=184978 RepID=A0A6A5KCV5_9PLEO|nr:hypothetical protein BDW02DRAFT_551553 [Decorospora gaudefroyi]